jgi:dephospho-CoA kinase
MSITTSRLGLTGGIGSGKSTVANLFEELGAFVIDADKISHGFTATGGGAIKAIKNQFGADLFHPDGSLNRDRMRALIFNDNSARHILEGILHPLIQQEMQNQYQQAVLNCVQLVVYDIPLLAESSYWRRELDSVLVVDCTNKTQIHRVMARNALARETIEKIVTYQIDRFERLKVADYIIFNENIAIGQLRNEVRQVAEAYGL